MINNLFTFNREDVALKIICGRCEHRVEMIWHDRHRHSLTYAIAHVVCHGIHRVVSIAEFHTRIAEFFHEHELKNEPPLLVLLWEQLPSCDPQQLITSCEHAIAGAITARKEHPNEIDAAEYELFINRQREMLAAMRRALDAIRSSQPST